MMDVRSEIKKTSFDMVDRWLGGIDGVDDVPEPVRTARGSIR